MKIEFISLYLILHYKFMNNNNNNSYDFSVLRIPEDLRNDPKYTCVFTKKKFKQKYRKFKLLTPKRKKPPTPKNIQNTKMMCFKIHCSSIGPKAIPWKGKFHYSYKPLTEISLKTHSNIPLSVQMNFDSTSGIRVTRKFHLPIWENIKNNFDHWCAYSTYTLEKGIMMDGTSYNKLVNVISSYGYLIEIRLYP